MSEVEKRKCQWCGKELNDDEPFCTNCKFALKGAQCNICKAPMWPDAVRCNACGSYRGLRRFFNFSTTVPTLLSALVAITITAIVPLMTYYRERNSHTVIRVVRSDDNQIFLKVWNTGRKPSALIGYRLKFEKMPKAGKREATLEPTDEKTESVIEPKAKATTIALSVPLSTELLKDQYTPEEVKAYLADRKAWIEIPVTVEVDVRESDDDAGQTRPVRDPIVAQQIAKFLQRIMS